MIDVFLLGVCLLSWLSGAGFCCAFLHFDKCDSGCYSAVSVQKNHLLVIA